MQGGCIDHQADLLDFSSLSPNANTKQVYQNEDVLTGVGKSFETFPFWTLTDIHHYHLEHNYSGCPPYFTLYRRCSYKL